VCGRGTMGGLVRGYQVVWLYIHRCFVVFRNALITFYEGADRCVVAGAGVAVRWWWRRRQFHPVHGRFGSVGYFTHDPQHHNTSTSTYLYYKHSTRAARRPTYCDYQFFFLIYIFFLKRIVVVYLDIVRSYTVIFDTLHSDFF